EDGIRDRNVTGVQTCALPISQPADNLRVRLGAARRLRGQGRLPPVQPVGVLPPQPLPRRCITPTDRPQLNVAVFQHDRPPRGQEISPSVAVVDSPCSTPPRS